jgi:energy-coupling factor transport system permease protein
MAVISGIQETTIGLSSGDEIHCSDPALTADWKRKGLIYQLDPRTKMFGLIVYSILVLIFTDINILLVLVAILPVLWISAGLFNKTALGLLFSSLAYIFVMYLTQLYFTPIKFKGADIPQQVVFSLGNITITDVIAKVSLIVTSRMGLPLIAAFIVICTSQPMTVVRSFARMGLPQNIVLVVASSFRLLPIAFDEIQNIQQAQRVRGLRARGLRSAKYFIFPWLVSLLRQGNSIGLAVESKGFSNRKRKAAQFKEPRFTPLDYVFLVLEVIILVVALCSYYIFHLGQGEFADKFII